MAQSVDSTINIKIGEQDYIVRPTFKGIAAIERVTGEGLLGIVAKMASVNMTIMTQILYHSILANGYKIDYETIGNWVVENSMAAADYCSSLLNSYIKPDKSTTTITNDPDPSKN